MLLTGRNLSKSYGPRLLFAGITLGISEGERIGLIGANGSGKSTLLRILAGSEQPDDGELVARRQLRVGYVPQEDAISPGQSCLDFVAAAMDEHLDEHDRHLAAETALDRAGFADSSQATEKLSGGWRKRLAVVSQIVREPDLLLLDEPTNHLDTRGFCGWRNCWRARRLRCCLSAMIGNFWNRSPTGSSKSARRIPMAF